VALYAVKATDKMEQETHRYNYFQQPSRNGAAARG